MASVPRDTDPYASFYPRWGRAVALVLAAILLGGCIIIAVVVEGPMASAGNRASLLGFGAFSAFLMWRLGGVRADVNPQGITIRNAGSTRRLDWAQIVAVRFSPDDAWVRLDLSDGDTVSVLAVQRADGARSEAQARRLAALVAAHGEAPEPRP
ncbi:PH domain-containing protein [Paraoerskovia marina]|uniref:PH domain-containing protein n=1 Tax=Paraoerskovia marina TaxID=545619 RepID=A0A1H1SU79_9CELL|nr:PH domain-containing protein [Paraoerskovia marina]SDS51418.1 PH domain-containing protein [Paraoerskovia marina]